MDAAAAPNIPPDDGLEEGADAPPKGDGAGVVEDWTPKTELAFVAAPVVEPPKTDALVPNTPPPPVAVVVTVDAPKAGGFAAEEPIPKAGGAAAAPAAIAPNDGVAVTLPAEFPPKVGVLLLLLEPVPKTFVGAAFAAPPKLKAALALGWVAAGCCGVEAGVVVAALPPNENELALEGWPKTGLAPEALALPNMFVEEVVEVVMLPKAGGAVVGAEVGAIDEVVAFPNPPKVGAGAAAVVVVAKDPNEGVVEVLVEPKAGTVELLTAPNAGGAVEDGNDDGVPNANEVEPGAPKVGGAAEDVIVDAGGVGAALAAGLAAPPNENALVAGVADAALVVTGFAPKLNPDCSAAEVAAVVVTVPKAGGAAGAAELAGGLNALNPLAPKAIGFAGVEVVVATAG
uniref:(northern house mosquito) hypothetical protein n=1 Tax=Culex pipiens TaxID=7175 RepID=A0A8D8NH42_CULPI